VITNLSANQRYSGPDTVITVHDVVTTREVRVIPSAVLTLRWLLTVWTMIISWS